MLLDVLVIQCRTWSGLTSAGDETNKGIVEFLRVFTTCVIYRDAESAKSLKVKILHLRPLSLPFVPIISAADRNQFVVENP